VLFSAAFYVAAIIAKKRVLMKEHAAEFLAVFYFINLFLVLPFTLKANFDYPPHLYGLMFVTNLIGAIGLIYFTKALRHLEISEVAPLMNLSPLFLLVIALIFLREIPTSTQLSGIILTVFGAYFLELNHRRSDLLAPFRVFKGKFYHYLLITFIAYSIGALLDKVILGYAAPFSYYYISRFNYVVIFLVYFTFRYDGFRGIEHGIQKHGLSIFFITLLSMGATLFYLNAASIAYITLVIPLKRLENLFVTLIGGEVFHDHHLFHKAIACVIMIIGASFIIMG
jgi:drug/metabolite transporter (DMT)-like permease